MIYEAKNPRFAAHKGGKLVQFHSALRTEATGDPLGVLDTAQHPELGTEAEAVAWIESLPAYRERQVGQSGIWKRTDRIATEHGAAKAATRSSVVADMTEATLRGIIAGNGIAVPVTAKKADLEAIVGDILAGKMAQGAVPEIAASPESVVLSPESTGEDAAPKKAKKK